MYSWSESFLSVVGSTLHLLVVTFVCTALAIHGCIKKNRFTKLMKVIISYWIVWICMSLATMVTDKLLWPIGIFSSLNRLLREHTTVSGLLNILNWLGWLYIASMPWVMLTWLLIKKEHGFNIRRPENKD